MTNLEEIVSQNDVLLVLRPIGCYTTHNSRLFINNLVKVFSEKGKYVIWAARNWINVNEGRNTMILLAKIILDYIKKNDLTKKFARIFVDPSHPSNANVFLALLQVYPNPNYPYISHPLEGKHKFILSMPENEDISCIYRILEELGVGSLALAIVGYYIFDYVLNVSKNLIELSLKNGKNLTINLYLEGTDFYAKFYEGANDWYKKSIEERLDYLLNSLTKNIKARVKLIRKDNKISINYNDGRVILNIIQKDSKELEDVEPVKLWYCNKFNPKLAITFIAYHLGESPEEKEKIRRDLEYLYNKN